MENISWVAVNVCIHPKLLVKELIKDIYMKKVSRKEAKSKGYKYYFTGKPCKYGHTSKRSVKNRNCILCSKIAYSKDPKRISDNSERSLKKKIYKALSIYGFKCQECGEEDIVLLQWHHRNGRENYKLDDYRKIIIRVIKAGKKLDDVMLLCPNCHFYQDIIDGTSKRGFRIMDIAEEYGFVNFGL